MNEDDKTKIETIAVVIFVIFIIILCTYAKNTNRDGLGFLAFGSFFVLAGIAALVNKSLMGIPPLIIGLVIMSYSITTIFGSNIIDYLSFVNTKFILILYHD